MSVTFSMYTYKETNMLACMHACIDDHIDHGQTVTHVRDNPRVHKHRPRARPPIPQSPRASRTTRDTIPSNIRYI